MMGGWHKVHKNSVSQDCPLLATTSSSSHHNALDPSENCFMWPSFCPAESSIHDTHAYGLAVMMLVSAE